MRKYRAQWLMALGIVALDQATKALVVWQYGDQGMRSIPLWPGVLHLLFTQNRGMAFGLMQGEAWAYVLPVVALVLVPVLRRFLPPQSRLADTGAAMVMAGGFSNLLDKLIRGYVVDFFEIRLFRFAIFNVADIFVTCGIVLMLISMIRQALRREAHDTP